jgi:hypothetical protein
VGVGGGWTEESGNREERRESLGPAHAAKSTRGWHHTDRGPAETLDGEDTRRLASTRAVVRSNTMPMSQLETQRLLETTFQEVIGLARRRDEAAAPLGQAVAAAGWECEALGKASSCPRERPHRAERQTDHEHNELGTDLVRL